jgi:tRNA1Val (adenine37-N6)-methyltransferase
MKVCTDACLFGAMAANYKLQTSNPKQPIINCLDIGAGTGLLSLMFAQKNLFAKIDAVEIEDAAASQARSNFDHSPWKERLRLVHTDIKQYDPEIKYDFIFSNPPFFENDLLSMDPGKNRAKHDSSLSLHPLLESMSRLLKEEGEFVVLLPYHRLEVFEALAAGFHFHPNRRIAIKQIAGMDYFRVILFYSKKKSDRITGELTIKGSGGNYSAGFIALLQDYYLKDLTALTEVDSG